MHPGRRRWRSCARASRSSSSVHLVHPPQLYHPPRQRRRPDPRLAWKTGFIKLKLKKNIECLPLPHKPLVLAGQTSGTSHASRPVDPQTSFFDAFETPEQTPCKRSEGG